MQVCFVTATSGTLAATAVNAIGLWCVHMCAPDAWLEAKQRDEGVSSPGFPASLSLQTLQFQRQRGLRPSLVHAAAGEPASHQPHDFAERATAATL